MRSDIAADSVDAAFETLGEPDCSYQPPAGAPVPGIRLMIVQPDGAATFGETRSRIETTTIDVRASEVASPSKGGIFTISGAQYRISAAPERRDARRLIWRCEAVPV